MLRLPVAHGEIDVNDYQRFLVCLPFTLKQEGGNSNDPHDPGGCTHDGIIQREYDKYRQSGGEPLQSVYLASTDEVNDIYYTNYWLPHCPQLQTGLDLCFFDQCVNEGPFEAIKLLQRALGITADGLWGDQTLAAVKAIANVPNIISAYSQARKNFYISLPRYRYFGAGWIRRTNDIQIAATSMTEGTA